MLYKNVLGALALAAALATVIAPAQSGEEPRYPDLRGEWRGTGGNKWPTPAPLTAEYQAIFEAGLAEQERGGQGNTPTFTCLPPGMPRQMNVYEPMEIIVTPHTTYMWIEHVHDSRRIYTDGRDWPKEIVPTFQGYSIGKWLDTDGDGVYDTLETETRGLKGPRTYDTTGLPLHLDNKTVVKEKMYGRKDDPNIILNEITTIDSALTGPWTVTKKYFRNTNPRHNWLEEVCAENNPHINIQNDNYMLSAEGLLMPSRKGQKAPDLRYFDKK